MQTVLWCRAPRLGVASLTLTVVLVVRVTLSRAYLGLSFLSTGILWPQGRFYHNLSVFSSVTAICVYSSSGLESSLCAQCHPEETGTLS